MSVKITIAAQLLGVSHKTVYNWVADGLLTTTEPGYVDMEEAEKAKAIADMQKVKSALMRMLGIRRDERGRFTLL